MDALKIGVVIQARMSSTRLPGKVLADVCGQPMLSRQLERVRMARVPNCLIVATTNDSTDQPIVEFCKKENVICTQGSLNDVLDRYYQAARANSLDVVVRVTSDCPVLDPNVIDDVVSDFLKSGCDYVANTAPPEGCTYPDGMDVEVFSMKALERAWREATLPSEREHVTFHFWKNPGKFKIKRHDLDRNLSGFRLTVDYPADLEVIRAVYSDLYPKNSRFTMDEVLDYLVRSPLVREINAGILPNQGWKSALERDKEVQK